MQGSDIIKELRQQGWIVVERPPRTLRLPREIAAKHPNLPNDLSEFLSGLDSCVNATQTAWFLCEADYAGTSGSAFRWNEWEQMSLAAADGDSKLITEIRMFWDAHLPISISVDDGYAYHAVRTTANEFGQIVEGREPLFEEASVVAESFAAFMSTFLRRA